MTLGKLFLLPEDEGRMLVGGIYRHGRHLGSKKGNLSVVRNCLGTGSALFGGPATPSPVTGSHLAFYVFLP